MLTYAISLSILDDRFAKVSWAIAGWCLLASRIPILLDALILGTTLIFIHAMIRPRSSASVAYYQIHGSKKDILGGTGSIDEYSDEEDDRQTGRERDKRMHTFQRQRDSLKGKYNFYAARSVKLNAE